MTETPKAITLRALEVFEELSRTRSLRDTARALGISPPAASQQLRNLELALGQPLIDHTRRPLELTQAGRSYHDHVRGALRLLRQGAAELALADLTRMRSLRLGIIDDFDAEVTPRLTLALAGVLTNCDLTLMTQPSHAILEGIADRSFDVGIAARPFDLPAGLAERPLLRDPFVLAAPRGLLSTAPDSIAALGKLPYLRHAPDQFIGRQIAAHLARMKLTLPGRIVIDSNQAMFGMVAAGAGWAITTPLGWLRARRMQGQVDLFPLPFAAFSRTVSLFHRAEPGDEIATIISATLRSLLRAHVVEPATEALPWVAPGLMILPD